MNDQEIRAAWLYMREFWPSFPLPRTDDADGIKLAAWRSCLADIDAAHVTAAVSAMSSRDFPPNPGQIRAVVVRATREHLPEGDQAWAEVLGQISRVGWRGTPVWSHPAVAEAVAAMGRWIDLCASEDLMADRAHFMKLYAQAQDRHARTASLPDWAAAALSPAERPAIEAPAPTPAVEPPPRQEPAKLAAHFRELAAQLRAPQDPS